MTNQGERRAPSTATTLATVTTVPMERFLTRATEKSASNLQLWTVSYDFWCRITEFHNTDQKLEIGLSLYSERPGPSIPLEG